MIAQDVEAQQSQSIGGSSTAANVPEISTQTASEQQQYGHSGRGGAGNWYSPVELARQGTFSSSAASPTSPSTSTSTSAIWTGAAPVELPSARTGRGGAGNFVWGAIEKEKEEAARRRQEEERVKVQATVDVEQGLAKPSNVFLPAGGEKRLG